VPIVTKLNLNLKKETDKIIFLLSSKLQSGITSFFVGSAEINMKLFARLWGFEMSMLVKYNITSCLSFRDKDPGVHTCQRSRFQ